MSAIWYVEPEQALPAHLTPSLGMMRLAPTAGPDGARPGGFCLGGPLEQTSGWRSAGNGLWLAAERPRPEVLIRSDRPACTFIATAWGEVPVPHLLEPDLSYATHLVQRYPIEECGVLRVAKVIEHQEMADRLAEFLRALKHSDAEPDLDDAALWALALDLLAMALHVSPSEFTRWELLVGSEPISVIFAAADLMAITGSTEPAA